MTATPNAAVEAACRTMWPRATLSMFKRLMMERALAAYEAALWRPIAEAPRDGTSVLLLHRNGDMTIAKWMDAEPGKPAGWEFEGAVWFDDAHVTHFQPLPAPPTHDGGAHGGR